MPLRRRSFVIYSAALAAASCNRQRAGGKQIRVVTAGTPAAFVYLPHALAQQLNLYRNEGLALAIDAVPGGTKGVQALIGGSADVVVGFYDHSVRMAAQGQAIRSFITMTRYPGNILVVSAAKSKTVQTVEDLKNSTVGVSDLGSQSHLFLNYVLLRHGLAPSDVTTIATGTHRAAVAALEHGTLDAWSGFDPGAAQYRKRYPFARVLADARLETGVRNIFGVNAYPGSVLYAKADWLQRNPDSATRLTRAVLKSLHWIQEHSPEQIMENVPASYFGGDRAVYREALVNAMAMYSPDGMMPPEGPSAARKVLEASLDVARITPIDLAKTYTNEFVSNH